MMVMTGNGEARTRGIQAEQSLAALRHIRRLVKIGESIVVLIDPWNTTGSGGGDVAPYPFEMVDTQLSSLVGRTVIAANGIVSSWAKLYAVISGHSLPFVASLFDKWAREDVQRERIAKLAREFLEKLPREREHVETLLMQAETLARERDLLVSQPWSLGQLHEPVGDTWPPAARSELTIEREAQFESLLASLHNLHAEVLRTADAFRMSRDLERMRVLNRSAILAAEFKFGRKAAKPKSGPRHKEWRQSEMA